MLFWKNDSNTRVAHIQLVFLLTSEVTHTRTHARAHTRTHARTHTHIACLNRSWYMSPYLSNRLVYVFLEGSQSSS